MTKQQHAFSYWNSYWFRPASLFNLAVCRIVVIAFQLFYLVKNDYLGQLLERSLLPDSLYQPLPVLQFLLPLANYRPSAEILTITYWLAIIAGMCSLLGIRTKVSLLVFAMSNLLIQAYLYSFGDFHHPEALMLIALFVLALSPAGGVLSYDNLQRRLRSRTTKKRWSEFNIVTQKSPWAGWSLLLIQWLFALIYLSAAMSKILQTQPLALTLDWMNGYTLQFYLIRDGIRWGSELGVWLGQHHTFAWLSSIVAILFESTFWVVLLFPKLAWLYIPAGTAFHTGIYWTQRAPFFQYIALYSVFVPWASLVQSLSRYFQAKKEPKLEVFYDGLCPLCIRSMIVLRYFDWFERITYSNLETQWYRLSSRHPHISLTDCRQRMHVLLPHGAVRKGFFAFRAVLKYLPLLWPLHLICCLPMASVIGPKVYQWVAWRRSRFERCSYNHCLVDSKK
ncbi:MAG: DCC1-like thiol-disulfide oxidoreductase family protein [Cyanophyceae cyanobacterium]